MNVGITFVDNLCTNREPRASNLDQRAGLLRDPPVTLPMADRLGSKSQRASARDGGKNKRLKYTFILSLSSAQFIDQSIDPLSRDIFLHFRIITDMLKEVTNLRLGESEEMTKILVRHGADRHRKPRTKMSDEEMLTLALARFTPNPASGEVTTYEELERQHGRRRAVIQRAVREAFRRGLIYVQPIVAVPEGKRVARFEDGLNECFGIAQPLVLRSPLGQGGDVLLEHLGWMMGRYLGQVANVLFTEGCVVAVSSGRGVHHTVRALRAIAPTRRWGRVVIASLTGAVGERPVARLQERDVTMLDADAQASWLCCCFGTGTEIRTIEHRIAVESRADAEKVLQKTWLGQKWLAPRAAVVGVGVLNPRHRFYKYAQEGGKPFLESIAGDLRKLYQIAEPYTDDEYGPVADLCQRFFFVVPPADRAVRREDRTRMERLIESINDRLITVSFPQLAEVDGLYVVAGGKLKARAVYHVLTQLDPPVKVRALAVDEQTAEQLIHWKQNDKTGATLETSPTG